MPDYYSYKIMGSYPIETNRKKGAFQMKFFKL